ncbi:OsmC family protein [Temperatibacter marinus]|uniref:OsmC family protein n=1 Tax=Temperatibacter marinus TaxID=1456591 RepID=A0AA52H8G2_9PROT|nr:OsmC family protein [Temperatibacter marinus]WND01809.1 OsmC family protein [Temperatibacter marinus]
MKTLDRFKDAITRKYRQSFTKQITQLGQSYLEEKERAIVRDYAATSSNFVPADQTLYSAVKPGQYDQAYIPIGVHEKIGGKGDFPNPGELFCASLAACLDSCIRLISTRMGVELTELSVAVEGVVDIRATLRLTQDVPVGFKSLKINVLLEAHHDISQDILDAIVKAAEHSCVILQTLKSQPSIDLEVRPTSSNAEAA